MEVRSGQPARGTANDLGVPFNNSGQLVRAAFEWSATRVSGITAQDAGADNDYAHRLVPAWLGHPSRLPPAFVHWRPRSEHAPCVSSALWKGTIGFPEHHRRARVAGVANRSWYQFLTIAGMISVVTSAVVGSAAGLSVQLAAGSSVPAGVAIGLATFAARLARQRAVWAAAARSQASET